MLWKPCFDLGLVRPVLDLLQLAYQENIGLNYTTAYLLDYACLHLDKALSLMMMMSISQERLTAKNP